MAEQPVISGAHTHISRWSKYSPKAVSFTPFRFNMFGSVVMNLLEASPPLLTHCPHSHVSIFSPLARLRPPEAVAGDTLSQDKYSFDYLFKHMLCCFWRSGHAQQLWAGQSFLQYCAFTSPFQCLIMVRHLKPHFKALFDKNSMFLSFLQTARQWDILCKTRNVWVWAHTFFFSSSSTFLPHVSKNLVAVRFCEFGTEHSDVNLQLVWFWKHPRCRVW